MLWVMTLLSRARTLFITRDARRVALEGLIAVGACIAALLLAWAALGLFVILGTLSLAGIPGAWPVAECFGALAAAAFCFLGVALFLLRRWGLSALLGPPRVMTPPDPR